MRSLTSPPASRPQTTSRALANAVTSASERDAGSRPALRTAEVVDRAAQQPPIAVAASRLESRDARRCDATATGARWSRADLNCPYAVDMSTPKERGP